MSIKRLKKISNETIFINGTDLPYNQYVNIPVHEYLQYISDEQLLINISNKKIIVNDGENDIENVVDAWNFLIGKNEPPKTNEGFWTVLIKKESELEDSELFHVVFSRFVNLNTYFEENIFVPKNKILKITNFVSDSPSCSFYTCLEYCVYYNNNFYVANPIINPDLIYDFVVDQTYNSDDTYIKVRHNDLYQTYHHKNYNDKLFCLKQNNETKYFVVKSYNDEEKKLFIEPLNFNIDAGTKLANLSSPVVSVGSESAPTILNFESPLKFYWPDQSYIKIITKNISTKDVGIINITLNGYLRNKEQ